MDIEHGTGDGCLPDWARDLLATLPGLMDVEKAAEVTTASAKTIRRRIGDGSIKVVRLGDRVLIPRLNLIHFLIENGSR